jgi:hypothetical protein
MQVIPTNIFVTKVKALEMRNEKSAYSSLNLETCMVGMEKFELLEANRWCRYKRPTHRKVNKPQSLNNLVPFHKAHHPFSIIHSPSSIIHRHHPTIHY